MKKVKKYQAEAPQRRAAQLQKLKATTAIEREKLKIVREKEGIKKLKQKRMKATGGFFGDVGQPSKSSSTLVIGMGQPKKSKKSDNFGFGF